MDRKRFLFRTFHIFLCPLLIFSIIGCQSNGSSTHYSSISSSDLGKTAEVTQGARRKDGNQHSLNQIQSPKIQMLKVIGNQDDQFQYLQVNFLKPSDGWVTGAVVHKKDGHEVKQAVLWHTIDGGHNWTMKTSSFSNLSSVQMNEQGKGWAIAGHPCSNGDSCKGYRIVHTSDYGAHWTLQWQVPKKTRIWRTSLQRISDQTAFAVIAGNLLKTSDGGNHWHKLSVTSRNLDHLYFVNGQIGWVSGPNGNHPLLYKTVDGGAHWSKEYVPQLNSGTTGIQGISFINSMSGWVLVSSNKTFSGALYHTSDGGDHWQRLSAIQTMRPYAESLHFVNAKIGVIPLNSGAGPIAGGLLLTHDGGKHFQEVGKRQGWSLSDAEMVTGQVGWAVGGTNNTSYLLHTIDSGKTWAQVKPVIRPNQDIQFVDSLHGFGAATADDPNAVLTTKDGGLNWKVRFVFPHIYRLSSVSFASENNGMALLRNTQNQKLIVYRTVDSGRTWNRTAQLPQHPFSSIGGKFIRLFDSHDAMVQMTDFPKVTFFFTHDGGKDWHVSKLSMAKPPGTQDIVSFIHPKDGFLFLDTNNDSIAIYRTKYGLRWKKSGQIEWNSDGSSSHELVSAQMISDQTGYLLTEEVSRQSDQHYVLWRTSDGGKSWTCKKFPKQIHFQSYQVSMSFSDANHGWIQNQFGILQTKNGGKLWEWIK